MGGHRKTIGSRQIGENSLDKIQFGIVQFPREQWDWISYRDDLWGVNFEIIGNRENYGIWQYSCPEMAIFPALVGWLKRWGKVVIASPDGFLDTRYSARPGVWIDLTEGSPDVIPDLNDLLVIDNVYSKIDPSLNDATRFQEVGLSEPDVAVDYYVVPEEGEPEVLPCNRDANDYWLTKSADCVIFGTYIVPLESYEDCRYVFFGMDPCLISQACDFIIGALSEIQALRRKYTHVDDPGSFLNDVDRFVAEYPVRWRETHK